MRNALVYRKFVLEKLTYEGKLSTLIHCRNTCPKGRFLGRTFFEYSLKKKDVFSRNRLLMAFGRQVWHPMEPNGRMQGSRPQLKGARVTPSNGPGEDNRRGKRTNNDTTRLVTPKGSADFPLRNWLVGPARPVPPAPQPVPP